MSLNETPPQTEETKNTKTKVKIISAGGVGHIGGNMTLIEYQNEIIIIDCGILFPDQTQPGIDLILPDFSYVIKNKSKVKAILITHGHEDHIGGIPYLLKEMSSIPLFAPRLAMELIRLKLKEAKIQYPPALLKTVRRKSKVSISPTFQAEYVEVSHSIPDSFALYLSTPLGKILHTGDFKMDFSQKIGSGFDFKRFGQIGGQSLLALLSDSTNVEKKSTERSEQEVVENIAQIIKNLKGRVFVVAFSSNMQRMSALIDLSEALNRKICVFGRSMENNIEICKKLGYIKAKKNVFVSQENLKKVPLQEQLILMTGSQGEPMSALSRVVNNSHKKIKLNADDSIIISASVIPGNEKSVSAILNTIAKIGAKVFYSKNSPIHISGHASKDHLQLMLHLTAPKYFIPLHGEQLHLQLHSQLAENLGLPKEAILIPEIGKVMELGSDSLSFGKLLNLKPLFVKDGKIQENEHLIEEKNRLSNDGLLSISIVIQLNEPLPSLLTDLVFKGCLNREDQKKMKKDLISMIEKTIQTKWENDKQLTKSNVQSTIEENLFQYFKSKNISIPYFLCHLSILEKVQKKNNSFQKMEVME